MTTKEVNQKLGFTSATPNLAKLYKYGEVKRRKVQINDKCNYGYVYKAKCLK